MPKEKPRVNIGEVIRTYRSQRSLSQGDIERRTGLLRCYLSRVENGHTVPSSKRSPKSRKPWTSLWRTFSPVLKRRATVRRKSPWRALADEIRFLAEIKKIQHHAFRWRQAAGAGDDPQDGYLDSASSGEEVDRAPPNCLTVFTMEFDCGTAVLLPRPFLFSLYLDLSTALAANDADGVGQGGVAPAIGACLDFHASGVFQVAAFTGRQEEIGFDGVLLGVEVVVTAAESVQSLVRAALDDAPASTTRI